jgi:L-fucose:H+ symporter permease
MVSRVSSGLKAPLIPFILITSLFFLWGLANNLTDTLLAAFKRIMSMTDFETAWIQVAFYGSYFCLALPAAMFIKRYTYQTGVLLGLGLYALGALLFYPSSIIMQYGFFLASLFILAGGLSILETAANPYILAMGDEATATRRLNLAQSFNPIGSISGVVISKFFILSRLNTVGAEERAAMPAEALRAIQQTELTAVMGPYVTIGIVLLALWLVIAITKMPKASDEEKTIHFGKTIQRLIRNKNYVAGVVAQFFYVGAQICVWSFTIRYVMAALHIQEAEASGYYIAALIVFHGFQVHQHRFNEVYKSGNSAHAVGDSRSPQQFIRYLRRRYCGCLCAGGDLRLYVADVPHYFRSGIEGSGRGYEIRQCGFDHGNRRRRCTPAGTRHTLGYDGKHKHLLLGTIDLFRHHHDLRNCQSPLQPHGLIYRLPFPMRSQITF